MCACACECALDQGAVIEDNGFSVALKIPCCCRLEGLLACTCVSSLLATVGSTVTLRIFRFTPSASLELDVLPLDKFVLDPTPPDVEGRLVPRSGLAARLDIRLVHRLADRLVVRLVTRES